MRELTPLDFTILNFFNETPRPVRELVEAQPRGSVYRRLKRLQADGWVIKRRHGYALTAAGQQVKAEREAAACLGGLGTVYAPLTLVPSPCLRAVLELALASLVVRQLTPQEERHPSFLLLGPTMAWKTSAGRFLCLAAGVDPTTHIVDLASESGRSLWIRRGPDGEIASRRRLLEAPVVVFDELQLADPGVRRALAPFLSGRRRVPVENEVVRIAPVALLTMNPGAGKTLTERTGLAAPQLRRMIVCDLGRVEMPNLVLVGGRALEAAANAGPLPLRPPQDSAERFRPAVARLLPLVLQADVLGLVDVDLLLGLATGMTAWLPAPVAVRQTLSDFLLIVDTIGWTRPGWTDALRTFPGDGRESGGSALPVPDEQGRAIALPSRSDARIHLFPTNHEISSPKEKPSMSAGYSLLPTFTISDRTKADVIWLARDADVSVDRALQILVEIYRLQQANGNDFWDLETILYMRKACEASGVAVSELRDALSLFASLQERGLTLDDIRTTLKVAEDLSAEGLYLEDAVAVAAVMKALEEAGIDATVPEQIQTALARYAAWATRRSGSRCWRSYRIASSTWAFLSMRWRTSSLRCNASGRSVWTRRRPRRSPRPWSWPVSRRPSGPACWRRWWRKGVIHLSLPALHAERDALRQDVQQLGDERAQLQGAVAAARAERSRLQQEEADAQERVGALQATANELEDGIAAAQTLEAFFRGLDAGDRLLAHVANIAEIRQKHPGRLVALEHILAESVRKQIREFLVRISATPNQPPPPTRPGAADTSANG